MELATVCIGPQTHDCQAEHLHAHKCSDLNPNLAIVDKHDEAASGGGHGQA